MLAWQINETTGEKTIVGTDNPDVSTDEAKQKLTDIILLIAAAAIIYFMVK